MLEPIAWHHLGLCSYDEGLRAQERHWQARCAGGPDVGLVLEHPPTVTLGRRATEADVRVSRTTLAGRGIACVPADRGGQATYHGPGQLVLYPIVDLQARAITIPCFVSMLEQTMIHVAQQLGIKAVRDPRGPGVWAAHGKLGAVGIRVRHHVTTHGLALNVNPDLDPFAMIVPCGMPNGAVTSLARETGRDVTLAAIAPRLEAAFELALAGRGGTATCTEAQL